MNGFLRLLMIVVLAFAFSGCSTAPVDEDSMSTEASNPEADFADPEAGVAAPQTADGQPAPEQSLEDELSQASGEPAQQPAVEQAPAQQDDIAAFESEPQQAQEAAPPIEEVPGVAQNEPPPPIIEPQVEIPPPVEAVVEPSAPTAQLVNIKNIKYKANDNGGAIVIDADGPVAYTTRANPDTNQFIIEIKDSKLPDKLKRPYNTKDMAGGIGAIDAYQNNGSTVTRVVVQLRPGVAEPTVQSEGNSLLVVASNPPSGSTQSLTQNQPEEVPAGETGLADTSSEGGGTQEAVMAENAVSGGPSNGQIVINTNRVTGTTPVIAAPLSAATLEAFIAQDHKFYGEKISLEVNDMDLREVINLLSEESGINMVLSDSVRGVVSVKLRQVPWDQAFIVVLKAKRLGYLRTGNIVRIAPLDELKREEDDAIKLADSRKNIEPLVVKKIPVSYSKVEEMIKQITPFLSTRGKAVGDNRTSSFVLSDIAEVVERVERLVSSIDSPPNQVLIEGKIVEATDQFQRSLGINWGGRPTDKTIGSGSRGPIRMTNNSFNISPGIVGGPTFAMSFSIGTIDVLGDLAAQLAIQERISNVKVLSSPRIVTMHNETADITQTTAIPLITSTPAAVPGAAPAVSVTFKPISLRLSVLPQITNDASVIMGVDVNRDVAGAVVDEKSGARPINSRSAKTKVLVKNGQTAVIGGIYQSDTAESESHVPWLANIPVLGYLFKSQVRDRNKNELLIFLTPRILGALDTQGMSAQANDLNL